MVESTQVWYWRYLKDRQYGKTKSDNQGMWKNQNLLLCIFSLVRDI